MPTHFDDEDKMVCVTPLGSIDSIVEDEDRFAVFIAKIQHLGIHPLGCFSCNYFSKDGCDVGRSPTSGFCRYDEEQRRLELTDLVNAFCSCDGFVEKQD